MFLYGFLGLIAGFCVGMFLNIWLLRNVPNSERLTNRSIRMRYGLLNWAIALLGMGLGLWLKR